MRKVKWGKFRLDEIFDIKTTIGIDEGTLQLVSIPKDDNFVEFVGRTKISNGIKGYIQNFDNAKINEENTISISQVGTITAQLRKNKWFASQNMFKLMPKDNRLLSLFTLGSINRVLDRTYSAGYSNYPTLEKLKQLVVELPVESNGTIHFSFINSFISELEAYHISELEAYHISELEAYLNVTGLKDYKLSKKEETIVKKLLNGEINYKKYKIVDLFDVKNSGNILSSDITDNSGDTPYLGATSQNNGVISYISYDESLKEKGNCVFIGGKTFVVSYQEKDFYSNDSHNLSLYYKNKKEINKSTQLFFCSSIFKSLYNKYFWNNSISKAKIYDDYMMIPINDKNEIDYVLMATIISAIQKLIIKDVVLYSESKIKMTKKVVKDL